MKYLRFLYEAFRAGARSRARPRSIAPRSPPAIILLSLHRVPKQVVPLVAKRIALREVFLQNVDGSILDQFDGVSVILLALDVELFWDILYKPALIGHVHCFKPHRFIPRVVQRNRAKRLDLDLRPRETKCGLNREFRIVMQVYNPSRKSSLDEPKDLNDIHASEGLAFLQPHQFSFFSRDVSAQIEYWLRIGGPLFIDANISINFSFSQFVSSFVAIFVRYIRIPMIIIQDKTQIFVILADYPT